ncbi:MAG: Mrp/NBP35 family ATP-binding protein [Anaerolineae bacterium]|nr:Mrp/NBP35 family ATP-binding protein [Anaerolineae bacterium]
MITEEQVFRALRGVMHPEFKRDLVKLEMIKSVAVEDDRVTVTLALPFIDVPVKDDLVRGVKEAVSGIDSTAQIEVDLVEMSQRERAAFMGKTGGEPGPAASANDISHVVAVLSGKGGVGKSSVAALLAVALRRRRLRVGVLDADITGPSIPMMFGLHRQPAMSPLGILPVETSTGIKVMSINLLLQSEDQAVIWRGPLISNAIKQFWTDVAWGVLDYLVVDLPPGTSDASLTVMQSIPLSGVVLVTSPQDLAGMVVRKAASMAQKMGAPIVGLVENMSYVICPQCGQEIRVFGPSRAMQTAAWLGVPLLGQLPLDAELACHCDEGEIEAYDAACFDPMVKPLMDRMRVVNPV